MFANVTVTIYYKFVLPLIKFTIYIIRKQNLKSNFSRFGIHCYYARHSNFECNQTLIVI